MYITSFSFHYEPIPHFTNKERAQEQTVSSGLAGFQTQAGWLQSPCSLLLDSQLGDYTFLEQTLRKIHKVMQEPQGP